MRREDKGRKGTKARREIRREEKRRDLLVGVSRAYVYLKWMRMGTTVYEWWNDQRKQSKDGEVFLSDWFDLLRFDWLIDGVWMMGGLTCRLGSIISKRWNSTYTPILLPSTMIALCCEGIPNLEYTSVPLRDALLILSRSQSDVLSVTSGTLHCFILFNFLLVYTRGILVCRQDREEANSWFTALLHVDWMMDYLRHCWISARRCTGWHDDQGSFVPHFHLEVLFHRGMEKLRMEYNCGNIHRTTWREDHQRDNLQLYYGLVRQLYQSVRGSIPEEIWIQRWIHLWLV